MMAQAGAVRARAGVTAAGYTGSSARAWARLSEGSGYSELGCRHSGHGGNGSWAAQGTAAAVTLGLRARRRQSWTQGTASLGGGECEVAI